MSDASGGRRPAALGGQGRLIAGALLGGLAVLFAVLNLDEVRVHWMVGTWSTPLIVVVVLSGLRWCTTAVAVRARRCPRAAHA